MAEQKPDETEKKAKDGDAEKTPVPSIDINKTEEPKTTQGDQADQTSRLEQQWAAANVGCCDPS